MVYLVIGILLFVLLVKVIITRDFFSKLSTAFVIISVVLFIVAKIMNISVLFTLAKVGACISIVTMAISFLVHLFGLD